MKIRKKKRFIVFFAILLIFVCIWFFSNFVTETTYTEIRDKKIKDEITIVHISDLHGMNYGGNNQPLIDKIKAENPDFVAVTGDMFTYGDNRGEQAAIDFLSNLSKLCPVYFVNGEHDNNREYMNILSENGVKVLDYKDEKLRIGNTDIHLFGITNVYYTSTFDLENAFLRDDRSFNVLLAHSSNFTKFAAFGIDLSLCGDTHGGIFRLPFIGSVYDGEIWFPDLNGNYEKGLYTFADSYLYITGGLGNYPLPLRFCNRPEISIIKLLPED